MRSYSASYQHRAKLKNYHQCSRTLHEMVHGTISNWFLLTCCFKYFIVDCIYLDKCRKIDNLKLFLYYLRFLKYVQIYEKKTYLVGLYVTHSYVIFSHCLFAQLISWRYASLFLPLTESLLASVTTTCVGVMNSL